MATKMVTKMVTKEPSSITSVRLFAPTVLETVGNSGVTEGYGGDEGALTFYHIVSSPTYLSIRWYY